MTAVQAGTHTVKWQVAAGLNGKAKATLAGNRAPAGLGHGRRVRQAGAGAVDPETGKVMREGE